MLVGISTADDAAVVRLRDDLALVLTVDFFTPIVDDPYDFGQIAAANSLSDVYAMGGEPLAALSIVAFPATSTPLDVMGRILRGAADKAREAGIDIVGGHSVEDPEPKFGLAVTGTIHPDRILSNNGARPGDALFVTKPLGSGVLTTALRRGLLDEAGIAEVTRVMGALNGPASRAALAVDVHACTDVTGFGMLGHIREMIQGQGLGVRLSAGSIPRLGRVSGFLRDGVQPGGTQRNLDYFGAGLLLDPGVSEDTRLLLADPQTSGGLLVSVAPERAAELAGRLHDLGIEGWAEIGWITADQAETIVVAA